MPLPSAQELPVITGQACPMGWPPQAQRVTLISQGPDHSPITFPSPPLKGPVRAAASHLRLAGASRCPGSPCRDKTAQAETLSTAPGPAVIRRGPRIRQTVLRASSPRLHTANVSHTQPGRVTSPQLQPRTRLSLAQLNKTRFLLKWHHRDN